MRLVTINLQWGGKDRIDFILNYLIRQNADFLVLGEYKDHENGDTITKNLKKQGYSFQDSDDDQLGVLLASKHPFTLIKRERRLVGIELSDYNLRILGVYVPTGSKDKKIQGCSLAEDSPICPKIKIFHVLSVVILTVAGKRIQ